MDSKLKDVRVQKIESSFGKYELIYFSDEIGFAMSATSYDEKFIYVFDPNEMNSDQLITMRPANKWSVSAIGNKIYVMVDNVVYEGRMDEVVVKEEDGLYHFSWECPSRPSY